MKFTKGHISNAQVSRHRIRGVSFSVAPLLHRHGHSGAGLYTHRLGAAQMTPDDMQSLIGLWYELGADGPDSYDCRGLLLDCQRACFGKDLPR